MASIRAVRNRLVPVIIGLVVIDLACIGYLLSPAGRSRQARMRDLPALQEQLAAKRVELLPTRGMDEKLKKASTDVAAFSTERFPTQYSAVSDELGKRAADSGAQIAAVKYDDKDTEVEGLRKLEIEVTLSGSYLQEVKFINALERDTLFFVIDSITLGEQQSSVRLQLKVETYLRAEATRS